MGTGNRNILGERRDGAEEEETEAQKHAGTDGPKNRRIDKAFYIVACPQLKREKNRDGRREKIKSRKGQGEGKRESRRRNGTRKRKAVEEE